jgi:hypothetical protein
MTSVLLLTFTVSSGFVSNGYHKAYARGNLDALGTKIRESINNQITEELSDSAGPNPSSSSGSSSLSPSSGSSGLTTPSPTPTTLTLSVSSDDGFLCTLSGTLKTDTGSVVEAPTTKPSTITFIGESQDFGPTPVSPAAVTNEAGDYFIPRVFCGNIDSVTAHYAGAAAIQIPAYAASNISSYM